MLQPHSLLLHTCDEEHVPLASCSDDSLATYKHTN
jgi:hypothetical protein